MAGITATTREMIAAMADGDFCRAAIAANSIVDHPKLEALITTKKSDFSLHAAYEVLDICMLNDQSRRELAFAFNHFRAASIQDSGLVKTIGEQLQNARQGEEILHEYAAICPYLYCQFALDAALLARTATDFGEAQRIAGRAQLHALSFLGESNPQYSFVRLAQFYVTHIDDLPDPQHTDQLRKAREVVRKAFGKESGPYLGTSELITLCDLRDGFFENAREAAENARKSSHLMPGILPHERRSPEMLEVQSLISLGHRDEALELFEKLQSKHVSKGIGFRKLHEKAFDAVLEVYESRDSIEKIPGAIWSKRKSSAQIELSRLYQTVMRFRLPGKSLIGDHVDYHETIEPIQDRILMRLFSGDIHSANEDLPRLLALERQHPECVNWEFDTAWISQDIHDRLDGPQEITESERTAISMSWKILASNRRDYTDLISKRRELVDGVAAANQQNSANAFYLHWALSAAFRSTGRFSDALRELKTAFAILKVNKRERSPLGLLLSRDEMLLAAILSNETLDPSTLLLPHELNLSVFPAQAHFSASCYAALASFCVLRKEYEQAWNFAYYAEQLLGDGEFWNSPYGEWSVVATVSKGNSAIRTSRESPESELKELERVRKVFEERGEPDYPAVAWYFYEMEARIANECGHSKKAKELRQLARIAVTPIINAQ